METKVSTCDVRVSCIYGVLSASKNQNTDSVLDFCGEGDVKQVKMERRKVLEVVVHIKIK